LTQALLARVDVGPKKVYHYDKGVAFYGLATILFFHAPDQEVYSDGTNISSQYDGDVEH
jgi:hypothetical protein